MRTGTIHSIRRFVFLIFVLGWSVSVFSTPLQEWKIESVRFENNMIFEDSRLQHVILSRPSSFLHPRYFNVELFQEDLKTLETFYHQNGYLQARVVQYQVLMDSSRNAVHITIDLAEGELTRIEDVAIFGNRTFSNDVLISQIQIHPEEPLQEKKIKAASLAILTLYADHGFVEAKVEPNLRVNEETNRAILDFNIKEGTQFSIDRIHIQGLDKTRPDIVQRELRFRSGEIVNYSRLLESQRQVYLTGLFQSVFVRPQPTAMDSTKKDILIEVKENMSIEFNVAAGYGSVDRLRGRVEIVNNNLRGRAHKLGLAAKISFINRGLEASFTEPRLFGTPWETDVRLSTGFKEEPGYDFSQVGGVVSVGRHFVERSTVTIAYREEHGKLSHVRVSEIPAAVKTDIRSLRLSVVYDTRNNMFNPTEGAYLEWTNELGSAFAGTTNGFVRSLGRFKFFYSWTLTTVVATALEIGWMMAQGGLQAIPLQERFYAGGPNSLRGFEYQRVGPLNEDRVPTGGRFKVVWNVIEIRRVVYKSFGVAVFADLGNVWEKPEQFQMGDIRFSPGIGIRWNTPIGSVRLDFGINPGKKNGEPVNQLMFSMGQAF